jgi:purine operon repressor
MGRLLASQFYKQSPDFVLTVETKGIALAMATADALGISCVVARRGQQSEMEWPYVSLNYISGTSGKLQTMSVTKKLVHEGQRALIVDDYMKAGGTAKAMMEMMREFTITVVGVGMMLSRETEAKKQVEDVKSLMIIKDVHEELGANVVPRPGCLNRGFHENSCADSGRRQRRADAFAAAQGAPQPVRPPDDRLCARRCCAVVQPETAGRRQL